MIESLLQMFMPDSLVTNLFRYITFRALCAACFSFAFVILCMPKFIEWLKRKQLGQMVRDDGPKTHLSKTGTPTMGGVVMVIGILLGCLLFARLQLPIVWISLFALLSFGAVGFFDDFLKFTKKNTKGVSFRAKMLSLGALSILVVWLGIHFSDLRTEIHFPFLKSAVANVGQVIFYLWGFFVLCGASNAVNLTDGLDGLAIVPVMTTAAVLLFTSYVSGHAVFASYLQFPHMIGAGELAIIMASLIGVGLGFLWFNSHPAEIFMGDVGSLSLGGLLGSIAVLTHKELVLGIAGFLFVIEALSVMLQVGSYKVRKKRIFLMAPLHHHFELAGWKESKVIVRFWILSLLFAIAALSTLKIR